MEPSNVEHLAAAGGIKRCAIENHSVTSVALQGFDHASIELVEKGIVVVEAVSHIQQLAIGN